MDLKTMYYRETGKNALTKISPDKWVHNQEYVEWLENKVCDLEWKMEEIEWKMQEIFYGEDL